jgi:hypothetical protein
MILARVVIAVLLIVLAAWSIGGLLRGRTRQRR